MDPDTAVVPPPLARSHIPLPPRPPLPYLPNPRNTPPPDAPHWRDTDCSIPSCSPLCPASHPRPNPPSSPRSTTPSVPTPLSPLLYPATQDSNSSHVLARCAIASPAPIPTPAPPPGIRPRPNPSTPLRSPAPLVPALCCSPHPARTFLPLHSDTLVNWLVQPSALPPLVLLRTNPSLRLHRYPP